MGIFDRLGAFVESAGSIYLENERIKAGQPIGSSGVGNTSGEFPHVKTGVDYTGDTLIKGQIVRGVDNGALLAGAAVFLVLAAAGVALALD